MNIFAFLKNNIPSFEDEFVQSDVERATENAPANARRRGCRNIAFQQDNEQVSDDGCILPCSTDIGLGATSLFRD